MSDVLKDIWYFACPSSDLKRGKMERRFYCNIPVVIGRDKDGKAFALRDVCPHRAAPLSAGRQVEEGGETTLECPYHGWRIRTRDGVCAKIPALTADSEFPTEKVRTRDFPLHEEHGIIWIYIPEDLKRFDGNPVTPPPSFDNIRGDMPKIHVRIPAEGPIDEAVIGLVDPAHTSYLHRQWFWRNPSEAVEKSKDYVPTEYGFKMVAHAPSKNGRAYKVIGGAMTTEIEFRLPGIRIETINNDKHMIVNILVITPTKDGESEIHHVFFWDKMILSILKPVIKPLTQKFLGQDGWILGLQNENIVREKPTMLYVDDADTLAKWYIRLKRDWVAARAENRDFVNTLEPATLRWRT